MRFITMCVFFSLLCVESFSELVEEDIFYKVDSAEFSGYLVYDNSISDKRIGVIIVHEWWGHNAYARMRAKMLAQLGYTALAIDMYELHDNQIKRMFFNHLFRTLDDYRNMTATEVNERVALDRMALAPFVSRIGTAQWKRSTWNLTAVTASIWRTS